jgi:DNA-binding response OmpR family regulator
MLKQPKILFIEDSGFFRKAVAQSLASEGFDVITAGTGEDALKVTQNEQPDLILLDMMLPRLDGMMVLRILRGTAETRHTPVIVLSSNTTERDRTAAQKLGISYYFRKDSSPMEELVASIRSTIGISA